MSSKQSTFPLPRYYDDHAAESCLDQPYSWLAIQLASLLIVILITASTIIAAMPGHAARAKAPVCRDAGAIVDYRSASGNAPLLSARCAAPPEALSGAASGRLTAPDSAG